MKPKFGSSRQVAFLQKMPTDSVEATDLVSRSKFNFSYLDLTQPQSSPAMSSIDGAFLQSLFEKLKSYSRSPLDFWLKERVGGGRKGARVQHVFEVYKNFPKKTSFEHPKHVPHDVWWARFRVEGAVRLAGFVVPAELHGKLCAEKKFSFCSNTFYVVFIDLDHKFYIQ